MNIIEFIKENQVWVVPIIVAVLSGIIAGIFNLLSKNGKYHKQKMGDINNSKIINNNGDLNSKKNKLK